SALIPAAISARSSLGIRWIVGKNGRSTGGRAASGSGSLGPTMTSFSLPSSVAQTSSHSLYCPADKYGVRSESSLSADRVSRQTVRTSDAVSRLIRIGLSGSESTYCLRQENSARSTSIGFQPKETFWKN